MARCFWEKRRLGGSWHPDPDIARHDATNYEMGDRIGKGAYGEVFACSYPHRSLVIKVFPETRRKFALQELLLATPPPTAPPNNHTHPSLRGDPGTIRRDRKSLAREHNREHDFKDWSRCRGNGPLGWQRSL